MNEVKVFYSGESYCSEEVFIKVGNTIKLPKIKKDLVIQGFYIKDLKENYYYYNGDFWIYFTRTKNRVDDIIWIVNMKLIPHHYDMYTHINLAKTIQIDGYNLAKSVGLNQIFPKEVRFLEYT